MTPDVDKAAAWLVEALEALSAPRRRQLVAMLMRLVERSREGSVDRVWHGLAVLVAEVETEQRRVVEELDPDNDGELGGMMEPS